MKRTQLKDRQLPDYTRGEEIFNMVTHIVGGGLAVVILVACVTVAALHGSISGVITSIVYGLSMIMLYTMSSVYHGVPRGYAKKVLQVIDHCTIYFLISGTYTPVLLSAFRPVYPALGWWLFGFEWALAVLATVLTAIDLKKYSVFSMICYIGMGWAIIPFAKQTIRVLSVPGFALLLAGGIAYTIGSVLYGLGKTKKWMHSVFHIFVVLGAVLQYFAVLLYAI